MRLTDVPPPQPDAIFQLMRDLAEDERRGKIDLGVGVYRTETGETPVMAAVKLAERQLWEVEDTKSYVGFAGDPAFHDAIRTLTLGDAVPEARVAAAASTGGTGAVRSAFELVRLASPGATFWVSQPSWPNHVAILAAMGLLHRPYRHLDRATGTLDRAGQAEDLADMQAGDVLLLHGCCHNPTGVDLTDDDWADTARLCTERGVLPMVDLAYQGFGEGLDADVAGLRRLAADVPEMLLCVSASKTFGLYRERAGALLAVGADPAQRATLSANLAALNRLSISFPPDHGARLVTMILADDALRKSWEEELTAMRTRISEMRTGLAAALRRETNSDRFDALGHQRGMFSLLPATPAQMRRLRAEHAVYGVDDGRINLAGLTPSTIEPAARAIAAALF